MPSFFAVLLNNLNEPVYFIKVEEKSIAESELEDWYGHVIFVGNPNFKGKYLRKIRSTNDSTSQLKWLPNPVYIEPDKIYQSFVEIEQNLTMANEVYSIISSQLHHKNVAFHQDLTIFETFCSMKYVSYLFSICYICYFSTNILYTHSTHWTWARILPELA